MFAGSSMFAILCLEMLSNNGLRVNSIYQTSKLFNCKKHLIKVSKGLQCKVAF